MTKIDFLKKLLPGFLPLFIFIIADEIWGTTVGLYVAVVFGVGEFIFVYFKEKQPDKFIIIDTGLLIVLGLTSILLNNDIFFKLKPALIETILCIVLGISAFSSKNILFAMSKRYMKGLSIDEYQQKLMTRSMQVLFYIVLVHTLLVIYSAYYMSKEAWVFISGGLFYILFGIYFLIQFLQNKMNQSKFKNEEWFPLVDEEGKVIGKAPRSVCHKNSDLLHPVVHLHVLNKKGELFLQKRPFSKDIQPGKWDTAVGGHIGLNEDIETGLKREVQEELGINDFQPQLLAKYVWRSQVESELVFSFVAQYDQPIQYNKDEIADGKFWDINEIRQNIGKDVFTPNFENEFVSILQDKV